MLLKLYNTLKKINLIRNWYEKIDEHSRVLLYTLSPTLLVKYKYLIKRHKLPNLKQPETFDEKLLWLMIYWRHPLKTKCTDKYELRAYVKDHNLECILPDLLGVYNAPDEIDFFNLPVRFVLKCTHGCGTNIICKDKRKLNISETKAKLTAWMKKDISKVGGEMHYAKIRPRIICECFLDDLSGDVPIDYKIYCFNGKAHCTMVCRERSISERAKFYFYDREWNKTLSYNTTSMLPSINIPKPAAYEEMIDAAEKLSKPFPFVRMDFYSIKGKAVIGEMTFTPNGCIDTGYTDQAQQELGMLIKLPEKIMD